MLAFTIVWIEYIWYQGSVVGTAKMVIRRCFRGLGVGAHREPHVVGVAGEAGEGLLAVDDPLVAVLTAFVVSEARSVPDSGLGVADEKCSSPARMPGQGEFLLLPVCRTPGWWCRRC